MTIEVQSRLAAERATGILRLEKDRLNKEIKEALKARDSAEAGFKTITKQVEDLRQQLHQSEIKPRDREADDLKSQGRAIKGQKGSSRGQGGG